MPITFDEVSVDVERDKPRDSAPAAPQGNAAPDLHEQLRRELRLVFERESRVCDE